MKDNPYVYTYWALVCRHTDIRWLGRPNAHVWKIFQTEKEALDYYFDNSHSWNWEDWDFNVEQVKITPVR